VVEVHVNFGGAASTSVIREPSGLRSCFPTRRAVGAVTGVLGPDQAVLIRR